MGRQVNFYMTAEDETAFVARLTRDDAVWLPQRLHPGDPHTLREFTDWVPSSEDQRLVILRRCDWERVEFTRMGDPTELVKTDDWLVGTGASPVIELNCCLRSKNRIVRGRIYYDPIYLSADNKRILHKPDEDGKWFARLAAWLKRAGRPLERRSGHFLMPGAAAAWDAGTVTFSDT